MKFPTKRNLSTAAWRASQRFKCTPDHPIVNHPPTAAACTEPHPRRNRPPLSTMAAVGSNGSSAAGFANTYWLLRHGRSHANEQDLIISHPENGQHPQWGLTDVGRQQASLAGQQLAERLACEPGYAPEQLLVLASPFSRTVETAEQACAALGILSGDLRLQVGQAPLGRGAGGCAGGQALFRYLSAEGQTAVCVSCMSTHAAVPLPCLCYSWSCPFHVSAAPSHAPLHSHSSTDPCAWCPCCLPTLRRCPCRQSQRCGSAALETMRRPAAPAMRKCGRRMQSRRQTGGGCWQGGEESGKARRKSRVGAHMRPTWQGAGLARDQASPPPAKSSAASKKCPCPWVLCPRLVACCQGRRPPA